MDIEIIKRNVSAALKEDIGEEDAGEFDLTANLLPEAMKVKAEIFCRNDAILCGSQWFEEVFHQLDINIAIRWDFHDGESIPANSKVCSITGPAREILTGERTALNFLQTLSGTATRTRLYVDAVADTNTKILDTRKTLPGLRVAQKYAVRCGGGNNHRMGLFDAILIKENHISAAGSIKAVLERAKEIINTGKINSKCQFIEIEVENLNELEQAVNAGAPRILLDNFTVEDVELAVKTAGEVSELEVSGGIDLQNVKTFARTGIDYISVGDITKNLHATDFTLVISDKIHTGD